MKYRILAAVTLITALWTGSIVLAQDDEISAITGQLRAIKSTEAETRIPALYKVKSLGVSSMYSQVKVVALGMLREPVKSSLDRVRVPAIYAIADIARSSGDTEVELDALDALSEPMKAGTLDIRIIAIDALNAIVRHSYNPDALLPEALKLLNEPVDSAHDTVRMPAIQSILLCVEGSGNESAYRTALQSLRQPIKSSTKEVRFMTIDAVERIGVEAQSSQTKDIAVDLLKAPKKSDWSDALVGRAYEAEFKIKQSK